MITLIGLSQLCAQLFAVFSSSFSWLLLACPVPAAAGCCPSPLPSSPLLRPREESLLQSSRRGCGGRPDHTPVATSLGGRKSFSPSFGADYAAKDRNEVHEKLVPYYYLMQQKQ